MIAIECKAWWDGVEHDSMDRKGLVHFEVNISNISYLILCSYLILVDD